MCQAATRWRRRGTLVVYALAILFALLLPAQATADSRVRLQARIEPTYPVAGEEFRLRVQVTDNLGRPLDKAQVVATMWMEHRQNTSMAMAQGDSAGNALRLVGRPQPASGEYLFSVNLPESGRWRSQIWVNSSGATGNIPLDFDVVAHPPPTDTNWLLVAVTWSVVAVGSLVVWRRAKAAHSGPPRNLLKIGPLRSALRSRWHPAALQWPTLAVFALILYVLLAGANEAHDNLGSALTWVVWWPLLPLIFLLFGRLWCAVCPMSLLSDLSQRLFGRHLPVPAGLKRRGPWLILAAFLTITWADLVLGLVEVPRHTAFLLLAVTAGVVICGLIFERRAWCRYLCPIGGLSGNYAMAAALELRADKEICRTCRSYACVRGDGRTPGCPMFEFPRTMSSNHHCNLCSNCLKTCPNDALRLTPRPPADELGFARRGRWDEAILAATLLGAVAMQGLVMLGPSFPALAAWLGTGHGAGNPFGLTVIFVTVTGLPLVALGLAGLLSAKILREKVSDNLLRFAYALIPLGLGGHLAHNLNHLLGEGRSVANTASWLFGLPAYTSPVLESPSTVRLLQYGLTVGGALTSLAIGWRLARATAYTQSSVDGVRDYPRRGTKGHEGKEYRDALAHVDRAAGHQQAAGGARRALGALAHQFLIAALTAGLLVLFGQDMAPRLQLAEAHDQITPAQIATAKASVATFLGRRVALEYVHLEEHGYRDIILRSGENYYFVDAQNMLVSSTFSSRFRAVTPNLIAKTAAQQVALDFAIKHYPNFSRYNLESSKRPEETSPYPGGYVFEWRQYVDGVAGPNYVKVTTDALGVVAIYSARDVPVVAPSEPLVMREQAIAIAQRELEVASRPVSAGLDIGPEITGRQILRWTVELTGDEGGDQRRAEVVVDARSGEVLSVLTWR